MSIYKQLLKYYRIDDNNPDYENVDLLEELEKDAEYVIKSSLFRRLQIKTQVFPLAQNLSVRTRLTHTLEVVENSKRIANQIQKKMVPMGLLEPHLALAFVRTCQNASLIHDIGNPPFGHFGEETIKDWFSNNWEKCLKHAGLDATDSLKIKIKDFTEFDGNPQGIRFALSKNDANNNLNLTLPTILSAIKYPRDSGQGNHRYKKNGYFQTNKKEITDMLDIIDWQDKRYPLSYIMEAADDISYYFSDVEDSIEKGILQNSEFMLLFNETWKEIYGFEQKPFYKNFRLRDNFSTKVTPILVNSIIGEVSDAFIKNQEPILSGQCPELISLTEHSVKLIEVLKDITRKYIYRCAEVEKAEIAGHTMITSILNHFSTLLNLNHKDFQLLLKGKDKVSSKSKLEGRFFNRISKDIILNYIHNIEKLKSQNRFSLEEEWIERCHIISDYISGMTDQYVLSTYQVLEGISF